MVSATCPITARITRFSAHTCTVFCHLTLNSINVVLIIYYRLMIRFTEDPTEPDWKGYFYAVLLFVVAVVQSLIYNHYFILIMPLSMRARTAIIAAVYRKVCVHVCQD